MSGVRLLVTRSLAQHRASSLITVLATALASGLVMAVFALAGQTRQAFVGGGLGVDAVAGARGSPLQLVLNAVFHLETSPGNLPWAVYRRLADDPRVRLAVPLASGDSWRGFRVVGSEPSLFDELLQEPGGPPAVAIGRAFDPRRREAVLGASVAAATGLGYGDSFRPAHGLRSDADGHDDHLTHVHEEEFVVVGVLAPTHAPADRVVWIPLEAVFRMEGHVLRGAGEAYTPYPGVPIPARHKQVSAVLLRLAGPMAGLSLSDELNRQGQVATLAWPLAATVSELFETLGWMAAVLELVGLLVLVVAAGTILAALTNALAERRREFAILRALGARRRTLFGALIAEATTLAALGSALGVLVAGGLVLVAATLIRARTGVVLDVWSLPAGLWWTPPAMTLLGALAGWFPARRAYATDVASHLVPPS